MHDVSLPREIVDAVVAARGRRYVYEAIDPRTTTLVVVDMQNMFVADEAPFEVPSARDIVPNINRLAAAVRGAGGQVVWIQATQGAEGSEQFFALHFDNFVPSERRRVCLDAAREGSPHHALYAGLDVAPGDRRIKKSRFSAFIQGASDIERHLREGGIDTLLIAGTATNVCCESTARDAMMLGFKITMLSDATASHSDAEHLAGLLTMFRYFGDVRTTAEAIALHEAGEAKAPVLAAATA